MHMTFGEILKRKRLEHGWTQKQLADKVYSTVTAISQFEHDKHVPKTDMIYSLAEELEIPVEMLLFSGSNVLRDVDISEKFLLSDTTAKTLGYIPDKISITDAAHHQYRSICVWNPDYTLEKFLEDIIYPYVKNNPNELNNLLRVYGKKELPSIITSKGESSMEEEILVEQIDCVPAITNRLTLSKTLYHDIQNGGHNTVVIGTHLMGVVRHAIVPNILNSNSNLVVTDVSGYLYKETKDELKAKGYNVKIINVTKDELSRFDKEDIVQYNPVGEHKSPQEVSDFIDILFHGYMNQWSNNVDLVKGWMEGIIAYMQEYYPKEEWSIDTFVKITTDKEKVKNIGIVPMTDQMYQSLQSYMCTLPYLISKHSGCAALNIDEFIQNEKWVIFININPFKVFDPFMNMFLQEFIHKQNKIKSNNPVLYIMNEFENMGDMRWLSQNLKFSNQNNSTYMIITQSLKSFYEKYDTDTMDLFIALCENIVTFFTYDKDTSQFISKLSGYKLVEEKPTLYQKIRGVQILKERPYFTENEILNLNRDEVAVLVQGEKPIIDKVY